MDHDVRAVLDRPQQEGGGHGVVDDERHPGRVRGVRDAPDVQHVAARIAEGLGEERLRVGPHRGPPGIQVLRVLDERHLDAETGKRVTEEVVGAAVQGRGGDDVVPGSGQRQDRQRLGGLPRSQRDGGDPALQRGDALLQDVLGGVVDAGVDVARFGQREHVGRVLRVAEDEGRRLVDRHRAGAGRRVRGGAGVDLLGLERPGGAGLLTVLVLGGVACGDGVEGLAHVVPRTGR